MIARISCSVILVHNWRWTSSIFELARQFIVFSNELVNFLLNHAVLLVHESNVILDGLRLGQQLQIVVISAIVNLSLLLDLLVKFGYHSFFFGNKVGEA